MNDKLTEFYTSTGMNGKEGERYKRTETNNIFCAVHRFDSSMFISLNTFGF